MDKQSGVYVYQFSSVQSFSHVRLFATLWIAALQASLSITNSWSPPKLMSIESVMPSSHLILCCPLLLQPPIPPSIRVFSNESTLRIRWPKYWSFNFSISPSKEHPGLVSFRMDWLDLLAVQGTLKSLLQHHSSKELTLRHLAFFVVQLSHPYVTTGKTVALTRWTFVGKVMSLLLNILSRLVITFLPRSKRLLISWLQSPSAVILEPKKIKVSHCLHCFPICFPWSDGTGCHEAAASVVSLYRQMKENHPSIPFFRSQGLEHVLCLSFTWYLCIFKKCWPSSLFEASIAFPSCSSKSFLAKQGTQ